MTRNPRVIVIDQDLNARSEVQKLLALSGFSVVGEAGYGIEAVSLAKETEPDVVVIAIEEPIIRALQTVEALADLLPQSPIIGYSTIRDPASMRKAMLAGVETTSSRRSRRGAHQLDPHRPRPGGAKARPDHRRGG